MTFSARRFYVDRSGTLEKIRHGGYAMVARGEGREREAEAAENKL